MHDYNNYVIHLKYTINDLNDLFTGRVMMYLLMKTYNMVVFTAMRYKML